VRAIRRHAPAVVTLVAMGRASTRRADEDELCALYLRSRLEGRAPDTAALKTLLATMAPPPDPAAVAAGGHDPGDRAIAAAIDAYDFAVRIRPGDGGLLIAEAERVTSS
jgi:2-phosphosulfolactate phosphatase